MIEICSICGEWKLINGIRWDFIVDDQRGSSLSMIHKDISYNDLIMAVLEDFGIDGNKNNVNLSYASPSKLNFGTKELPPAFIRNDRQRKSQISPMIVSNMVQTQDKC
ncbi:hypothetical protein BRARA_G00029 [Brassica rapa]|uniref:Uncharacterized protein n=1 Tax=Brassica campestris TaxID=3711 RepID=A0A397YP49_BRACM|nr:hypothetical protein BRARA_G00029 [Brassica rapa]